MKSFTYTEELDRMLCDLCHDEDLAEEGFDLIREREIGEEIDEESECTRLARLIQGKDNEICIFLFGELHFFGAITATSLAMMALEKLSASIAAYFMRQDKNQKGDNNT